MSPLLEPSVSITRGEATYPRRLERLGNLAPPVLTAFGTPDLMSLPLLAILSSVAVPGAAVLAALDLVRALRDAGVPVIAGFHTPLEQEFLPFLLRGNQPLVIAPARSVAGMRVPRPWRPALEQRRLLVVSGVQGRRRVSADLAHQRNRLVTALADRILVVHATPGGRVHRSALEAIDAGIPVFCPETRANSDLLITGARPAIPGELFV